MFRSQLVQSAPSSAWDWYSRAYQVRSSPAKVPVTVPVTVNCCAVATEAPRKARPAMTAAANLRANHVLRRSTVSDLLLFLIRVEVVPSPARSAARLMDEG